MNKLIHLLATLIILGNLFIIGLAAYWQFQPYELPYIQEPIEILNENNEIAVGEPIKMHLYIVKNKEVRAVNQTPRIECESGNLVTLVGKARDLPVGSYSLTSDKYLLPPKVLVGDTCEFFFQTTFEINPLKTAQQDWVSEQFKVVER